MRGKKAVVIIALISLSVFIGLLNVNGLETQALGVSIDWFLSTNTNIYSSPTLYDLDNDDQLEIFAELNER